jgi:hypothetical protein
MAGGGLDDIPIPPRLVVRELVGARRLHRPAPHLDALAEPGRENHFDTMHLRLWQLDTDSGLLTIIPQDWFNEGAYDLGYQWVTRVARLPGSGDIVGEGIRLGLFRLDPSGRQLAEWLAEDVFYQPTADHIAEA